ncbi:MAG: hypothetical protein Q8O92_04105 [Candidatus Latescibacter sp.]|nr:hypothetical protein [Candidatus Latescibacter sp.]
MYTNLPLFFSLFLILVSVSEAFAADITWKIYLEQYQTEPLNPPKATREGEEFSIPSISLPSYASGAQKLIYALERTRFLIQQTPGSRPIEIHIILNNQGDAFEKARPDVPVFINITIDVYVDGRKDSSFRFLSNSPLVMTIPSSGVDALLRLCDGDLKRGEDLVLAFDLGTRFSNEGITMSNTTSGISAGISHPSTIVGSRYDLLKLQPPVKINTWGKIKLLFQ